MSRSCPLPAGWLTGAALLAALCLAATPLLAAKDSPLHLEDLLALARAGLSEALIREQVEKLGLDFQPTSRTILALKEAGLGEESLALILRKGGFSASSGPARETVRIFERVEPDGRRVLVLTNLDEEGNPLRDPAEGERMALSPARDPEPGPRGPSRDEAPSPPPAPIVVVNVQPLSPPVPFYPAPPLWTGSLTGPFRYPDRLGFLGYGAGIASPGWFSGLGLNAGNNYGHGKEAKPNTTGFDAFFGPPSRE